MICTKCSVDKPLDQYETYFHKPQGKHRTRKYCKDCFKEQKRKYKESIRMKNHLKVPNFNPIISDDISIQNEKIIEPTPLSVNFSPIEEVNPLSTNPDYKQCRTCQEYKHYNDYYHHGESKKTSYLDCRVCCNKRESGRRRAEREEWKENTGGSDRIPNTVNTYADEYQREQTFMVMGVLGYIYQDGHWIKPGVKELIDGKLVFHKVKKHKYKEGKNIDYTTDSWNNIWIEYNTGDVTQTYLAKKYNFSTTLVNKFIKRKKNEE